MISGPKGELSPQEAAALAYIVLWEAYCEAKLDPSRSSELPKIRQRLAKIRTEFFGARHDDMSQSKIRELGQTIKLSRSHDEHPHNQQAV